MPIPWRDATGPAAPGSPVAVSSGKWRDLRTRVLSAVVMVPLALGCVLTGGLAFTFLVALLAIGMAYEWLRLCRAPNGPRPVLMFASLPLAVFLAALGQADFALVLLALVTLVACVRRAGQGAAGQGAVGQGAVGQGAVGQGAVGQGAVRQGADRLLPFGVPYIGLGAVALVWLRNLPEQGRVDVIVLLLVIWGNDIGAYLVGRAIGGARLAPRISPSKTWSGAVGGLLAGMVVGVAAAGWLGAADASWPVAAPVAAPMAALAAGLIGCVGQGGDLLESALKRRFNVKDSGRVIPGHGGLLDRLDAVLAAAPVAALLAFALGHGVMPGS